MSATPVYNGSHTGLHSHLFQRLDKKGTMSDTTLDFTAIKVRQQATWSTGDYAQIGSRLQIVPELLCDAMDIRSGWTVLDVAAGNGAASLAAARRFCNVTSTDYVPELLARGQARAEADGLAMKFQEADAENLPFADATFDAAISTFGVMFTPNQPRSAAEMFRVIKPGGKIGLASWTPSSFVGQIFKTIGKYVPPPAGLTPPSAWGTEERLHELFPQISHMKSKTCTVDMRYLSPTHWLEIFRTYYGPMNRTYAALDTTGQAALTEDLMELIDSLNRADDGTLILPSEYLEVVITK
jgi:ubiquinone/menaquinone biosynthesis C-methylase UbiE